MSRFQSEVKRDDSDLLRTIILRVCEPVRSLLLRHSLIGHAQNGHGKFSIAYPNATLDDVNLALGLNPDNVRTRRQGIIDSVFEFTMNLMASGGCPGYVDDKGKPLLSLSLDLKLDDPAAVLKGMYLASRMDSFEWRTKTMNQYGVDIGGGECIAVDLDEIRLRGLTLDDLANGEWSVSQIEDFKGSGVIIDKEIFAATNKVVSAYIRTRRGQGTSDDLAIVLAGNLYGKDAAIGVFLCDAIDTWDKYAERLIPGGQDEYLGDLIEENTYLIQKWSPGFELPSEDDLTKFIYTIALQKEKGAISNSQRYLLQVDRKTNQCAFESHLKYILGEEYEEMHLGHVNSGTTNVKLYEIFKERFSENYS